LTRPDRRPARPVPVTRLRATHVPSARSRYLRPGGPWDVPTLDALECRLPVGAGAEVIDSRTRLDPPVLAGMVDRLAGGLRAAGVRRGDAVAWQLPNCVEAVLLFRACWRLGAVAVPLHHQVGPSETARMVSQVDPAASFSRPGLPLCDHDGTLSIGTGTGSEGWGALLSARPLRRGMARPWDLAAALFTSGSTGEPKVVLHTHRGLVAKARSLAEAHGLRPGDTVLMPAPLAHVSGLLNGVVLPSAAGMRSVLMERWDPERAVELVAAERVGFMIGPPTIFTAMADAGAFSPAAVSSLRVISCGSMTVSPDVVTATRRAFGATVKRTYGSTEAPNVTTSTWDDPPERARETDGRALGGTELRVVDLVSGRDVAPGQHGELLVRGPELFAGYADPDQTAAAMHRGWFRTGDLATLDAGGWLTIVGRRKELVIRAGENIVPAEVERVLEAHPAVRQAVVVGCPDPLLGERVAAFVVADGPFDLRDCRDWFAGRGVARFKTPELVVVVPELPVLTLGKPDRAALRARLGG